MLGRSNGYAASWKQKKCRIDPPGGQSGSCPGPADDESFGMIAPRHQYSVGVVQLFLQTVFGCAASQRAAAAVMGLFANWLPGVCETPCANTGRLWLLRSGLYELIRPKEEAEDWAWIMDHTLQLGTQKCLVIVGVQSFWQQVMIGVILVAAVYFDQLRRRARLRQ